MCNKAEEKRGQILVIKLDRDSVLIVTKEKVYIVQNPK